LRETRLEETDPYANRLGFVTPELSRGVVRSNSLLPWRLSRARELPNAAKRLIDRAMLHDAAGRAR